MTELIQELLLTHNCVIIPGFGAFIGNYYPAEIRLMDNKIFPPKKNIAFNRSLQNNDGLLINALSDKLQVSYKEAEEKVLGFSKECNDALLHINSLILKDIGRFVLDDEQKIQFQPYVQKNYLLDSFGLEALSLHPIHRLKDAEAEIKENYQRILHPELMQDAVSNESRSSKIPYWITAVLAIAFLTSTISWNLHKNNASRNYSSLLPEMQNSSPAIVQQLRQIVEPTPVEPVTVVSTIPVAEPVKTAITTPVVVVKSMIPAVKKSYIVVGAFFDDVHANKVKAQAEAKGYVVNMTTDYNNAVYRISVEVETPDVSATLQKIKADFNQRAWVYCTDCTLK